MRTLTLLGFGLALALTPLAVSAQSDTVQAPMAAPFLVVQATPADANLQPGQSVRLTVTVKNTGAETVRSIKLNSTLTGGLTFVENGKAALERVFLDDLAAGRTFAATYEVKAGKNTTTGTYENVSTVTAENHGALVAKAVLNVRQPQVLGESTDSTLRALDSGLIPGRVLGVTTLPETSGAKRTVFLLTIAFLSLFLGSAFIAIASQKGKKSS